MKIQLHLYHHKLCISFVFINKIRTMVHKIPHGTKGLSWGRRGRLEGAGVGSQPSGVLGGVEQSVPGQPPLATKTRVFILGRRVGVTALHPGAWKAWPAVTSVVVLPALLLLLLPGRELGRVLGFPGDLPLGAVSRVALVAPGEGGGGRRGARGHQWRD